MTLNLSDEQEIELPFDLEADAGRIMEQVLDSEACPYEASVDLTLTDDVSIRQMNREFRGMDRSTDVLSFPVTVYDPPADFSVLEEEDCAADSFDPESGELLLGDIVISVEHAVRQAEEYEHSLRREICFLFAHSMYHLIGYDHMTEAEASVMEEKQEACLAALGITRDAAAPDGGIRTDRH